MAYIVTSFFFIFVFILSFSGRWGALEAIASATVFLFSPALVTAYIGMAYIGMAYVGMAFLGMAYIVVAYTVMAYTVMTYAVMACTT